MYVLRVNFEGLLDVCSKDKCRYKIRGFYVNDATKVMASKEPWKKSFLKLFRASSFAFLSLLFFCPHCVTQKQWSTSSQEDFLPTA